MRFSNSCVLLAFLVICPVASAQRPGRPSATPRVASPQQPKSRTQQKPRSRSRSARNIPVGELAKISSFAKTPSNHFLVDMDVVRSGHPYLGTNAGRPHTGCHVYFKAPDKSVDPSDPTTYPPIYAVADGYVSRLDEYFRLRPIVTFGRKVSNVRYGVTLAFAQKDNSAVTFHYSIEPMIDPRDENFYLPFLRVKVGQKVKKGDVIAYMYLPDTRDNQNSHIHYNLIHARQFQAPAIFDQKIVDGFHARWGPRRNSDRGRLIPACMGFLLSAPENPFGTGAKLRL
jgi:murein DD-endopeptidase MepM/ murein hydrolase activator NlpD